MYRQFFILCLLIILFAGKVSVQLLTQGRGYGVLRVSDEGIFVDYHNVDCAPVTFTLHQ